MATTKKASKAEIKREIRELRAAVRQVEWYLNQSETSDYEIEFLQNWANDIAKLGVSIDIMVSERTGLQPAPFLHVGDG